MIKRIARKTLNAVKMFFQCMIEAQQMRADMVIRSRGYVMQDDNGTFRYIGR